MTIEQLWPTGSATGIGSLPGTDIEEAVKETFGELSRLPYLPELPGRGLGADMIGRSSAFLVDLPMEVYAGKWRVAARAGRELRRALDLLERDLDQLTRQAEGYTGALKVQCAGPLTLAASLELALGNAFVSDHGATRDLTASLAEGLRLHVADVQRRVPGAQVLLQLDEPSLPAVLGGRVRTPSGLHSYRAVPPQVARELLSSIVEGVGVPVIGHCCAPDVPIAVLRECGVRALALDLSLVKELDPLGEAIDAGLGLLAGVAPTSTADAGRALDATLADRCRKLWRDLGFAPSLLPEKVAVTPACGLAGSTPARARELLKACSDAARRLAEAE